MAQKPNSSTCPYAASVDEDLVITEVILDDDVEVILDDDVVEILYLSDNHAPRESESIHLSHVKGPGKCHYPNSCHYLQRYRVQYHIS